MTYNELCNGLVYDYEKLDKVHYRMVLNELRFRKQKNELRNYLDEQARKEAERKRKK